MSRSSRRKGPRKVGVRELRQNLSKYLAWVKQGERIEVTERGQSVALLAPLPPPDSILERLIAEGRATRPKGDLLHLGPPPKRPEGWPPLSEILQKMRDEERYN